MHTSFIPDHVSHLYGIFYKAHYTTSAEEKKLKLDAFACPDSSGVGVFEAADF